MDTPMTDNTARAGRVIISSTRAAAGVYADTTGPIIVDWLNRRGIITPVPVVVPDGVATVLRALRDATGAGVDVVITSGGTGLSPDDRTPEATLPFLERVIPGVAEEIRRKGIAAGVATAALTRGHAGVRGRCFIVNLPGSTGGVTDGLAVLDGVLEHVLAQLSGATHETGRAHG